MMARSLIFMTLLIPAVLTFKWPFYSVSDDRHRSEVEDSLDVVGVDLGVSQREKDTIFRSLGTISSYSSNNDCLKAAFDRLTLNCEETESNQNERVRAAITMALCELETMDHIAIPMECRPYTRDSSAIQPGSASSCVESLYRSPQLWSSYSGYLREIPQLCFAYRRWNDIDMAKRIYQNATLEKISLLKVLQRRQTELEKREERISDRIDDLVTVKDQLNGSLDMFSSQTGAMFDQIRHSWSTMEVELLSVGDHLKSALYRHAAEHGDQLASFVRHAEEEHSRALESLLRDTSTSLALVRDSLSGLSTEAQSISLITNDAKEQWPKLETGLVAFTNSLHSVNTAMEHLAGQILSQSNSMDIIAAKQDNSLRSLQLLSESMSQMSLIANEHMEEINNTALAIKNELLRSSSVSILEGLAGSLAPFLSLRGFLPFSSFEDLVSNPSLRIVLLGLKFVWFLVSSVFSSLVNSLVVFLSARVFNRIQTSTPGPTRASILSPNKRTSLYIASAPKKEPRLTFELPPVQQYPGKRKFLPLPNRALSEPPLASYARM